MRVNAKEHAPGAKAKSGSWNKRSPCIRVWRKKISILGVAAGLAFSGVTAASAQTIVPADTVH